MDRKAEELQYLGAVGIVAESFKILRSCFKLLGLITLTLVLPLSFVILAQGLVTQPLLNKIAEDGSFFNVEARSDGSVADHQINHEWSEILLFVPSYVAFTLAFSLLSTSAVVYTVACLYTGRELSYATVISVVPRVWKRLIITVLWFMAIMFAYSIFVAVVFVIFSLILMSALHHNVTSGVFWIGVVVVLVLISIGFFCVHVYISMIWQLANVVSIVEDKYGRGAMKKSRALIKGKRGTAVALIIIYGVMFGIIAQLFQYGVVDGGRHNIGVGKRAANGAVLVVLQCAVNLMWLLTQSVFYFVCKSYHHQSIDKSALWDHLEGFIVGYMPLKEGMNIQLEHMDP